MTDKEFFEIFKQYLSTKTSDDFSLKKRKDYVMCGPGEGNKEEVVEINIDKLTIEVFPDETDENMSPMVIWYEKCQRYWL